MQKKFYSNLYVQVLAGIALGVVFGFVSPGRAAEMKPLGDGFIKLVRMLIAPIVFTTVVVGIAHMGAMKDVGRIGLRALVYFEVVSSIALAIGLLVVTVLQPGSGVGFDPRTADVGSVAQYASASRQLSAVDFLLNIIPDTVVGAFARGEVLQVLLFAVLFGLALLRLGPRVGGLVDVISTASEALFDIVGIIMRLAPIGAFGAMAFTVGRYGLGSLLSLGKLMIGVYATCLFFIFIVLGSIAASVGFSMLKFLRYIGEEILIVLGTSSSESALPRLMAKLEYLGCAKPIVGLVVPTGYSLPRWYIHLHDHGGGVRRPGQRGAPDARPGAGNPRRPSSDVEGGGGGHRQRLRHAGRDPLVDAHGAGGRAQPVAGHRSVHVGGPRPHQPRRQRRGHHRGQPLGERVGQGCFKRQSPQAKERG
jgi:aerobic C4-dicarboxylate transport protein